MLKYYRVVGELEFDDFSDALAEKYSFLKHPLGDAWILLRRDGDELGVHAGGDGLLYLAVSERAPARGIIADLENEFGVQIVNEDDPRFFGFETAAEKEAVYAELQCSNGR